jgi:hypothetical protein
MGTVHVKHAPATSTRPNPTNKVVQFVSHAITQASLQLDVERHRRDIVLIALLGSMSISLFQVVSFAPATSTRPNPTNKVVQFVSHAITQASLQLDVERHWRGIVLIALLGSMSISLFQVVLFAQPASFKTVLISPNAHHAKQASSRMMQAGPIARPPALGTMPAVSTSVTPP